MLVGWGSRQSKKRRDETHRFQVSRVLDGEALACASALLANNIEKTYNEGKKHLGWSSPAKPALITPEPYAMVTMTRVGE